MHKILFRNKNMNHLRGSTQVQIRPLAINLTVVLLALHTVSLIHSSSVSHNTIVPLLQMGISSHRFDHPRLKKSKLILV